MRKRLDITKERLYDDYINKKKSSTEIASELKCSYMTVLNKMKEYGIPARKDGIKHPHLTKDYLYTEYVENKKGVVKIAREANCSQTAVLRRIKKYNIPLRLPQPLMEEYGQWTVLEELKEGKCLCRCTCGKEYFVKTDNLKSGGSTCCRYCARAKQTQSLHCSWKGYEGISGTIWHTIKESARKRGYQCDVTIEYVWQLYELHDRKCALTGLPIVFAPNCARHFSGETTASLDRIDSSKGYVEGNVQWVHKEINKIKSDCDQARFIELCRLVTDHSDLQVRN